MTLGATSAALVVVVRRSLSRRCAKTNFCVENTWAELPDVTAKKAKETLNPKAQRWQFLKNLVNSLKHKQNNKTLAIK